MQHAVDAVPISCTLLPTCSRSSTYKPANVKPQPTCSSPSRAVLQGHLDVALRSSSASGDDPDLLQRVDVRLQRVMDGDRGWDTFSLQYHIDGPMAAVFSQDNMTGGCWAGVGPTGCSLLWGTQS